MTITVKDILEQINQIAPFSLAESWDNNGLIIGSPDAAVTRILVGLDPSLSLIDEAVSRDCNLVITHHPAIFKPLPSINLATPCGQFIQRSLSSQISVIACHTNLDSAVDGVSDVLGRALGMQDMQPIIHSGSSYDGTGMGRIGRIEEQDGRAFIQTILAALKLDSVQVAGKIPQTVTTVAVCGGSGSDLAPRAFGLGADIYLTSEVKHSTARWAEEAGTCIVDGTHFSTEQFGVNLIVEKLSHIITKNNWNIEILPTGTEHHPFTRIGRNSL